MEERDLIEYKKQLAGFSEEELKERDVHLRGLATGEIQGPPVGYSSIDKQWLKYYSEYSIRQDIPKKSIYQYMYDECKKYDNKVALECFGEKITYKQFFKSIDKVSSALVASGVKKGDVVSVCLPNIPEVGYLFYAINKIGAVANMLDPRTDAETLGKSVDDANSKLLITIDSVFDKFDKVKDKTKLENIVTVSPVECIPKIKRRLGSLLKKDIRKKLNSLKVDIPKKKYVTGWGNFTNVRTKKIESVYEEDMPAIIAYTGGTTGVPKGVLMNNEAMNTMIIENQAVDYGIEEGDTCISLAPPWTYYGISNNFNVYLHLGVSIKLIPEFGPDDLGKLIYENRPSHLMTVPSALEGMINEPLLQNMDLSFLKTIIVGADKLDPTKEKEANDFFAAHNSKCKIKKGYGMTETTAAATYTVTEEVNIPRSVGVPLSKEAVAVFDDNGKELETGAIGNIHIKGPKNMKSYFGVNEDKNSEVFVTHVDGSTWVESGDLGHMDKNGVLYVDGRKKRMFTKNGFKIFSNDVETKILQDPRIEQCAVIAVESESTGFLEKAYITIKPEYLKDADKIVSELPQILKEKTYEYEIPDEFEVIDDMPLTGMNKIDFKALEAMATEQKRSKVL